MHDDPPTYRAKMDCFGLADAGDGQERSADQFLIADLRRSLTVHRSSLESSGPGRVEGNAQAQLLAVTDGIGNDAASWRASTLALDALSTYLLNQFNLSGSAELGQQQLLLELGKSFDACRARMEAEADSNPQFREMGASLTLSYIAWPALYLLHAGDSRCYLLRDRRLRPLTTDHTVARQLVQQGIIQPGQARSSRWSNVLSNAVIAGHPGNRPDMAKIDLRVNDALLLCTNGLSSVLKEHEIAEVLRSEQSAEASCQQLLKLLRMANAAVSVAVAVARFCSTREIEQQLEQQESAPIEAPGEPLAASPAAGATTSTEGETLVDEPATLPDEQQSPEPMAWLAGFKRLLPVPRRR